MSLTASDAEVAALIVEARQGSTSAINKLCFWLIPSLQGFSRGKVDGPLRTKIPESDLIQESLLGIIKTFDNFDGQTKSELLLWVRGILNNKTLESQRPFLGSEKRDIRREQRGDLTHSSHADADLADLLSPALDRLITAEEAVRVRFLISQLPDHYRQVVEYRFLQDLSFPEIALAMNRTEPAVKNIFIRAMETLSRDMGT
jgi:RNA polymerase sigma-70 factor (subfamily 1)